MLQRRKAESQTSLKDFVISRGIASGRGGRVMISCPFHEDRSPSMIVNDNGAYCFSCGKHFKYNAVVSALGGSVDDYVLYSETKRHNYEAREYKPPKDEMISLANRTLLAMPEKIKYLSDRGISKESIIKYEIGYIRPQSRSFKMPRYVIPTRGIDKSLVTAVYRQDPALNYEDVHPENKRYVFHWGAKAYTYGLDTARLNEPIVYTSGQFDTIILKQMGINAIGSPGEGNICDDLSMILSNSKVFILMDKDNAGIKASEKIHTVIPNSVIVAWENFNGKDVTDSFRQGRNGEDRIRRMLDRVGYPL